MSLNTVSINDRLGDGGLENVVIGQTDSTGDLALIIEGTSHYIITNETFATLPAAASNQGRVCRVTDLNNALFESNGTRWKPVNGIAVIGGLDTDASTAATAETNLFQKALPIGLVQNGDRLRLRQTVGKSGTAETASWVLRMGKSGNTGDAAISSGALLATTNDAMGMLYDLKRVSATSVRKLGHGAQANQYNGTATADVAAAVSTVDSMDTNIFYLSVNWATSVGTEIITVYDLQLELVSSNA
jgi:hypothetical protein